MAEVTPPVQSESPPHAEVSAKSPFDAIHIIEYELNTQGKPNTPGLMGINATAELLRAGVAKTAILSGVHYKGGADDERRISQVYADELRQRIPEIPITIVAEANVTPRLTGLLGSKDTGGDVSFLQKQAKTYNWKNVLVVAYEPHAERINKILEGRGVHVVTDDSPPNPDELNVAIVSSNELLQSIHPNFTDRFEASPYRKKEGPKFSEGERKKLEFMRKRDPKGYMLSVIAHLMPESMKVKLQS